MIFVLKTINFLILLLLFAFLGKTVNALIFEQIAEAKIIEDAKIEYIKFVKHYDSHKKTIVVIGRSTSIYSYPDSGSIQTKSSYADLLKEKVNVLNLSSIDLSYISQVRALTKFAQKNIPTIDLIVLENLQYLLPLSILEGRVFEGQTFNRIIFCGKINVMNWLPFSKLSDNEQFYLNMCNAQLSTSSSHESKLRLISDPCLKKYRKALNLLNRHPKARQVQLFSKILRCSQDFFYVDQLVPRYLIHYYFYGNLESLTEAFQIAGLNINAIEYRSQDVFGTEEYEPAQVIFANYYLKRILEENNKNTFLILPIFYNPSFLSGLPIFRQNDPRMIFLDVSDDIEKIKKEKNLKHNDIFVDGSHSRTWVHQLIADKINSKFLKLIKD